MSYLVLARKSRPQNFDQVVGQRPVVRTLQNSLQRNRVAHAMLFSGVRGVGKTTLARIMAKSLNCQGGTGDNPCNECDSCKAITSGSAIDLNEIDGASNRGIQEIRELKEKIRFLPTASRYKIIIIDEVHMLTNEAFNALLKTLEEPPDHVYFMFATTELHKIPLTILSRCQRYELKRVSTTDLKNHFQNLAIAEKVEIDSAALDLVVREAEGSVRDGLSLLDQVFSFAGEKISADDVIQVLGLVDRQIIITLCQSLLDGNSGKALKALDETFAFGIDLKRFTADILAFFRSLILIKLQGCEEILDLPEQEITLCKDIAQSYSQETIHLKLTLLMNAVEAMRFSNQPRLILETAFLKMTQADAVVPVTSILKRMDLLLAGLDEQQQPEKSLQNKKKTDIPTGSRITIPSPPPEPKPSPDPVQPSKTAVKKKSLPEATENKNRTNTKPEPEPEPDIIKPKIRPHVKDVRRDWDGFIAHVKDRKAWMSATLQCVQSVRQKDNELHLSYNDAASCSLLRTKENITLLTEFVLDFFQQELSVHFTIPEDDQDKNNPENSAASPQRQRQNLAGDPRVLMTLEIFNGQVGDIRVGPRSR